MVRGPGLFDRVRIDEAEVCWIGESRDEAGDAVRIGMFVGAGEGGNAVCRAGVGGWNVDTALSFSISNVKILQEMLFAATDDISSSKGPFVLRRGIATKAVLVVLVPW
jgi:hypothetical protein